MILLNYFYNFLSTYLFWTLKTPKITHDFDFKNLDLILMILSFIFCIFTTFKDPGIITPKSHWFSEDFEFDFTKKKEEKNEINFYLNRFCMLCHQEKPPKASHCKFCNLCIKNFDQ